MRGTKGRRLGKRVVCNLCGRKGYELAGNIRTLESSVAYATYPVPDRIAWLRTGERVCTHHIQLRPQPQRPPEVV